MVTYSNVEIKAENRKVALKRIRIFAKRGNETLTKIISLHKSRKGYFIAKFRTKKRFTKGFIPSQDARKRARIIGSVGLKQTRKVRERG